MQATSAPYINCVMLASSCCAKSDAGGYYVSPKLDGIRVYIDRPKQCGKYGTTEMVFARSHKRLPNNYLRNQLAVLGQGFDGELVSGDFKSSIGCAMTIKGYPPANWLYCIFNYFGDASASYCNKPYAERMRDAQIKLDVLLTKHPHLKGHVQFVESQWIQRQSDAQAYCDKWLAEGFEGAMLTGFNAPYEQKRSQHLVKLKPCEDSEYTIVGYEQEAYSWGKTVPEHLRGTSKPMVGSLRLHDKTGRFADFNCGSGLTDELGRDMFANWQNYVGKMCTVTFQGVGSDKRPRQPRFKGMRPDEDLLA